MALSKYQSMQCKARLITSGNRIVSNRQPEHTHSGNVATALARKAVGKMKTKMNEMNATSSSSQGSVVATLDNDVLMALPNIPVATWNQHAAGSDGTARSTNSVEGWHHGLQSLFQCHHPTVWTFMSGIQRDIQRQKALFLQATTGVSHPSARKYRALNDRVARAVAAYGRAEVLVYLRSIAYLSHA